MIDKINKLLPRFFFSLAILVLLFAVWGRIIELFGWRYSFVFYSPGRLIEFAGILVIFAIALVLRQIRNELRIKNPN